MPASIAIIAESPSPPAASRAPPPAAVPGCAPPSSWTAASPRPATTSTRRCTPRWPGGPPPRPTIWSAGASASARRARRARWYRERGTPRTGARPAWGARGCHRPVIPTWRAGKRRGRNDEEVHAAGAADRLAVRLLAKRGVAPARHVGDHGPVHLDRRARRAAAAACRDAGVDDGPPPNQLLVHDRGRSRQS